MAELAHDINWDEVPVEFGGKAKLEVVQSLVESDEDFVIDEKPALPSAAQRQARRKRMRRLLDGVRPDDEKVAHTDKNWYKKPSSPRGKRLLLIDETDRLLAREAQAEIDEIHLADSHTGVYHATFQHTESDQHRVSLDTELPLEVGHELAPTVSFDDKRMSLAEAAMFGMAVGIETVDQRGRLDLVPELMPNGVHVVDVTSPGYRRLQ